MADVEMKIVNSATPNMEKLANNFPKEFGKAIKSTGWWLQREIKQGIKSGAPGGQPYKSFAKFILNHKRKVRTEKVDGRTVITRGYREKRSGPLGRLAPATRYRYYDDSKRVVIGWISPSAEKLGTLHERGGSYLVTDRMRRYFWANGMPITATKSSIMIPRRPTIGPEYRENAPKVPGYIQDKVDSFIFKFNREVGV